MKQADAGERNSNRAHSHCKQKANIFVLATYDAAMLIKHMCPMTAHNFHFAIVINHSLANKKHYVIVAYM
jgi:hypothetical protein